MSTIMRMVMPAAVNMDTATDMATDMATVMAKSAITGILGPHMRSMAMDTAITMTTPAPCGPNSIPAPAAAATCM